jgi:excisionase family DNA binding protein
MAAILGCLLERVTRLKADMAAGPSPRLLTFEQTADALAVGRTTVQELVDRGELPVVSVTGRAVRVDARDVEAFVKRRRERRGA